MAQQESKPDWTMALDVREFKKLSKEKQNIVFSMALRQIVQNGYLEISRTKTCEICGKEREPDSIRRTRGHWICKTHGEDEWKKIKFTR